MSHIDLFHLNTVVTQDNKMIPFPLTRPNRLRIARAFSDVPRVDISIE